MMFDGSFAYELSSTFSRSGIEVLPAGTSALLVGDAEAGRKLLAEDATHCGTTGEPVVFVTATRHPRFVSATLSRDLRRNQYRIVDASGGNGDANGQGVVISHPDSPSDLTGISVSLARCIEQVEGNPCRVAVDGLSALVANARPSRTFDFLRVQQARFERHGFVSTFTLDPRRHDRSTVLAVAERFDVVLHAEERDGELRVAPIQPTKR